MPQFDFYLLDISFKYQDDIDITILKERIERLSIDISIIRDHHEIIYKHNSIYETEIYKDTLITEIIWQPNNSLLDRDHQYMLQLIIDHSKESTYTNEEILEILELHEESLISGIVCLHEVENIEPIYCIYSKNDWFEFHRYFLGIYPISEEYFLKECNKYFPELFFHEDIGKALKTLDPGLSDFSKNIVNSLTYLNNDFNRFYNPKDIPKSLKDFSSFCNIETTLEGNIKMKPKLTFQFPRGENKKVPVCCEPHMKLSQSDNEGDSHYYFNRIYFHGGKDEIQDGKVLIGHIGGHL